VKRYYRCTTCNKIAEDSDLLRANNPFDHTQIIHGCPYCKSVESFTLLCDEPGCENEVCGGWPSDTGYRVTCDKHYQNRGAS